MERMLCCYIIFGPSFFIIQKFSSSISLEEYKVIVFLSLKVLPATKGGKWIHCVKTTVKFILEELVHWSNLERMLIETISELHNYLRRLMENVSISYMS
jgi:hypothetical protein